MSLEILKRYNIKAKKALGQNFLVNDEIVENISQIVDVEGENIIEVGPGYGALTEKLVLKKPKSLNLVELDTDMIDVLNSRIDAGDFDTEGFYFKINNIDVLKFEPEYEKYSVIANIPYYITSPILRHFLYETKNKPENMVILMQKDVGDKILGKGKNKSGVLSLFIDKKTYVSEVLEVSRENFVPAPKVQSSVLLFESHDTYNDVDDEKFLEIIKYGFREPRKMLLKNFVNSGFEKEKILEIFKELDISEKIRGEDLNIDTWIELVKKI